VTTRGTVESPQSSAERCDLHVVAIGASAGGVVALPAILSALPPGFPAAVVIVVHLAPHRQSLLRSVLARTSSLPVREASSGDVIRRGVVYVAPPATHLVLVGGKLILTEALPVHFARPSVDVLFNSVAVACGARAVGVILTGAGIDGASGLSAIKRAGGRTIVQDPSSADHAGMPSAALATGCADFTLPLASISAALAALVPPTSSTEPTNG
jgi:two-component system chemotaxis response regulator CheB